MSGFVGLLLAAGSARRFGAPKLLQPLADGTPVAVAAARTLVGALPRAFAVVRPDDHALQLQLRATGLAIVANPAADQGIGGSLAAGVRASAPADGWLVALADMPWVRPATLRQLVGALCEGASLVAPLHQGRRGHPVGFAAHWAGDLGALAGDEGARGLLAAHATVLRLLPTDDPGVLADVDHPADLDRLA